MSEVWLPVLEWEGLYEVSDQARVRSLDRVTEMRDSWGGTMLRRKAGRILKQQIHHGYPKVDLWDGDRRRSPCVHILMLEAFVGPRPPGMWGLHWDDNRQHNGLSNLYWGTPSQNHQDCVRNGTHVQARKIKCPKGHDYTTGPNGKRICRKCVRDSGREYARRKSGYYERNPR